MKRCRSGGILLLVALTAACAGSSAGPVQPASASPCLVVNDSTRDRMVVALPHSVDPARAPAAQNAAERLLFAQLYETLVARDCEGRIVPQLAERWTAADSGRRWHFRLKRDATFTDGTSVTAQAVVESWLNGRTGTPARSSLAGVTAESEQELRVELHAAEDVSYFARPELAVVQRVTAVEWPAGSTAFRVQSSAAGTIRVGTRAGTRSIEFRAVAGDARKALDAGIDLLVAPDAATLTYARALPDYRVAPLPWSRTYALVARSSAAASDSVLQAAQADLGSAVPAETRAARTRSVCPVQPAPNDAVPRNNAIVFPQNDPIARGIAERLVALAWPATRAPGWLAALLPAGYGSGAAPVAQGQSDAALLETVRTGRSLAAVLPLPLNPAAWCRSGLATFEAIAADPSLRITALLEARDYLVYRPGVGRIAADGEGTIRFLADGR